MIEKELLYKILDFEVNWNKYHLVKQYGYIFRLQQIIDLFDKFEISDNKLILNRATEIYLKSTYNFVKNGDFLNHIDNKKLLEGVDFRLKREIQNSELKDKYPQLMDLDFNYKKIFFSFLKLRISLYKLEIEFNTYTAAENVEHDIEQTIFQRMLLKTNDDIIKIDTILQQFLNPFNKNINPDEILHYNLDFSKFNIL